MGEAKLMKREPITIHHVPTVVKLIKNTGATILVLTLAFLLLQGQTQAQALVQYPPQKMPGAARDIDAKNGHVWIIGTVAVGNDYDIRKLVGSTWTAVDGAARRIAVDKSGNPWVINSLGNIYRRVNNVWQQMPGPLRATPVDIAISNSDEVWITANDGHVRRWTGSEWTILVALNAKHVIFTPNPDQFFVVDQDGKRFFRESPTSWLAAKDTTGLADKYAEYAMEVNGTKWGVDSSFNIFKLMPDKIVEKPGVVTNKPVAPSPPPAQSGPTAKEQACFDAMQNVPYDLAGHKSWDEVHLRKLCKGTPDPNQTIRCFQSIIRNYDDWKRGISSCQAVNGVVEFEATNNPGSLASKSALSSTDMNQVLSWISTMVSSTRLPFCYRQSFGRGAGQGLSSSFGCAAGLEQGGQLCYPKCKPGHVGAGPVCWGSCPSGFKDIGALCQKPASYGRGAGWIGLVGKTAVQRCEEGNRTKGDGGSPAGQSCEMVGAFAYPKCKPGFYNVGANLCSPKCPDGYADTGTDCAKTSYGRGAGEPFTCKAGMERDGLTCYTPCRANYSGVGPVCWQNCPSQTPVNCGAGCATTSKDCGMAISDMVISPIMAAVSLATLGTASGATVAVNATKGTAQVATKASQILTKMKAIYASIEAEIKVAKLSSQAYKTSSSIINQRDLVIKEFSENFAEMTSYEINKKIDESFSPKAAAEIKLEWAKHHFVLMGATNADVTFRNVLTLVSVADPSGLLAVEKAFYHPVCKNDTPFPKVKANY